MNNQTMGLGVAAILVLATTAAVASYVTKENMQATPVAAPVTADAQTPPEKPLPPVTAEDQSAEKPAPAHHKHYQKVASNDQAAAKPSCNDRNIVGTATGAAAGGLLGSQLGNGAGKTVGIIGGVLGGGYLGNQYIPTRNITCRD